MKRILRQMRNAARRCSAILLDRSLTLGPRVILDRSTVLEGDNAIGEGTVISGAWLGRGTYIAHHSTVPHVRTGRYCAIADGVRAYLGRHPVGTHVSIHPSFFSRTPPTGTSFAVDESFAEHRFADRDGRYVVVMGSDVWVGAGAVILDGITIGDGAVVGAHAVVTRDLEPFGVYVGCPARLVRKRFDDETIAALLRLRWWDRTEGWIREHAHLFRNVDELLAHGEGPERADE